jgi:competence protein ComEC
MLDDKTLRSLILALGFVELGELTPEHWQVLSATATQHLIAISGLHIGIVAFGSLIFIRVIVRLLPLKLILSTSWQLRLMQANLR